MRPACSAPAPLIGTPPADARESNRFTVTLQDSVWWETATVAARLAGRYGLRIAHVIPESHLFDGWFTPAQVAALRCEPAVKRVEHVVLQRYY